MRQNSTAPDDFDDVLKKTKNTVRRLDWYSPIPSRRPSQLGLQNTLTTSLPRTIHWRHLCRGVYTAEENTLTTSLLHWRHLCRGEYTAEENTLTTSLPRTIHWRHLCRGEYTAEENTLTTSLPRRIHCRGVYTDYISDEEYTCGGEYTDDISAEEYTAE